MGEEREVGLEERRDVVRGERRERLDDLEERATEARQAALAGRRRANVAFGMAMRQEREEQYAVSGDQSGLSPEQWTAILDNAIQECVDGMMEGCSARDLRAGLVQVATVAQAWWEAEELRAAGEAARRKQDIDEVCREIDSPALQDEVGGAVQAEAEQVASRELARRG